MGISEGALLWTPDKAFVEASNLHAFTQWLARTRGLQFDDYEALWRWSVADLDAFWAAVWDYFQIVSESPYTAVRRGDAMPGVVWFEGARVNYAEHVLRRQGEDPDKTVFHHCSEIRPLARTTWRALGTQVRRLATSLREMGVEPGDRVVSYMSNIPETVVAMLAATAIGAVWSSAAPEFGAQTVIDRFAQIGPKVIFAADGYRFGGKDHDRRDEITRIIEGAPTLKHVVWLSYLNVGEAPKIKNVETRAWDDLMRGPPIGAEEFSYARVAHDHPLWVLFSSGTTGLPKAITHSHAGIIVEHYKMAAFHLDLQPNSVMYFYSTTGWMMWNSLMLAPLMGGASVLYDGSPAHPDLAALWRLAADTGVTTFGTSPTYIELMRKHGLTPGDDFDLSQLRTIFLAGSPATPETFQWFYERVKPDLWVTSQSGGTEFCSGVVVAAPGLPVHAGEIQTRALGVDVRVLDEAGAELIDEVGEMAIFQPMPSMPLFMWGDKDFTRYRESYFDTYPGVWRHGDFMKLNRRGGAYVYGRSDSTLNRFGVRIGSSEIYRTIEGVEAVLDSLVVCAEEPGGGFYMPLFVAMREGAQLDDALVREIQQRLRHERSPRHVPDEIIAAPAIPYTLSGKKMEVPVRKLLMGWPGERAFSRDAMKEPGAMDWYVSFAAARRGGREAFYTAHVAARSGS